MTIIPKTFAQFAAEAAAAAQAQAAKVLDFNVGSLWRAAVEAVASVALWLQGMAFNILSLTRASTSAGADLDSWMADFNLNRLAATPSTVTLTFARFTATAAAFVPVGSVAQTADGTQKFLVVADASNPAYSSALAGYTLAAGVASLGVAATSTGSGANSNVLAGAINTLGQAILYVDTVLNNAPSTGGADAESDTAFRARFISYLASLAKATKAAISYAITSTAPTVTFVITENKDSTGATRLGYFYVVVDDGSGSTPPATVTAISNAIDLVRALTVQYAVFAAAPVTTPVAVTVSIAAGYDGPTVRAAVNTAIRNYINGLAVGATLYYNQLARVIFGASLGVQNFSGLLVNGATADITPGALQVVRAGTVTVS